MGVAPRCRGSVPTLIPKRGHAERVGCVTALAVEQVAHLTRDQRAQAVRTVPTVLLNRAVKNGEQGDEKRKAVRLHGVSIVPPHPPSHHRGWGLLVGWCDPPTL